MSIQCLLEKCLRERESKTPRSFVRERGRGKRLAIHPQGDKEKKGWRDRRR
jgi:hypothetical protein